MTEEELNNLGQEIRDVTDNFEDKPWTENTKHLKEDFDINAIKTPNDYLKTIDKLEEVFRETRLLFLYAVLDKVCKETGKLYEFDNPYCASMKYTAVMKKDGGFYLQDEDGDFTEIFTSVEFMRFIDDQYWELYEENARK